MLRVSYLLSILLRLTAFLLGKMVIFWKSSVDAARRLAPTRYRQFLENRPTYPHAGMTHRPVEGWVAP